MAQANEFFYALEFVKIWLWKAVSRQGCWRKVNLQKLSLQKKEENYEFDGFECKNDKIKDKRALFSI